MSDRAAAKKQLDVKWMLKPTITGRGWLVLDCNITKSILEREVGAFPFKAVAQAVVDLHNAQPQFQGEPAIGVTQLGPKSRLKKKYPPLDIS